MWTYWGTVNGAAVAVDRFRTAFKVLLPSGRFQYLSKEHFAEMVSA